MIGVGIIGFGRIGAEHAGWLASATDIAAVAVADATPARQSLAQSRNLTVYADIEALLADPRIDAVLIATPTAMHIEHATRALSAGKHVMVEKPIALDAEQASALLRLATERGRILSVFHNRRWDIDYLTVAKAVTSGTFGKLINIESRLGQFASCVGPAALEYRPGWRNEAAFGGGGLYDWGSHFIDQIWRLLWPARPVRLFAQLRGNVWTADCDDFARVCIDFDSGAVALVEINTTTTQPLPRWNIDGTSGSASSPFSAAFDTHAWAKLNFIAAPGSGRAERIAPAATGLSETQIWEQFGRACAGDGSPAVTAGSVIQTMQLLDAARESSRAGAAVSLKSDAWTLD